MSGNAGFTLIELLFVMLIIAILIGIGAAGYSLTRNSAKASQAKADIELIRNALEEYRVEYGRYPASESGSINPVFSDLEEFGDLHATDPWGRAYGYSCSNRFLYSIWSEGVDPEDDADNIDPSRIGY